MNSKIFSILSQITIAFGFIFTLIGNNTIAAPVSTDIQNLAQTIDKHQGNIIEWSLYARESVYLPTEEERLSKKHELEKQFPDMEWKAGTDSIIGKRDHGIFSETIQILSTDNNRHLSSYIVYEAKGENWDSKHVNFINDIAEKTVLNLFNGNPILFSCIKGEFSEELNEFVDHSLDGLLQSLHASEVESVKEQEFYSMSAFSSLFAQTLSFTNKQMNMQIGLRKNEMGPGTTVVVGTPILTIEY
ncbi:YwmB family TATA-box binding protein [Lederbergia panacisoli]|uniref:YwmB family TATA-box binding protein n=1 Tax=Lederbergia panacisoli TaxID=1255251 RepID=UPI00214B14EA|nr:YwmB family TATA-box binding protein [Lederbergia panacisoli]MCR2821380.1 YwmB family TATA-box binding protein [Lederbergia panacisoli]